jgi:folate-binding Fe-S cluster repair protein YgfZ
MPLAKLAHLTDRGVVRVAGPDAEKFLNGSITADLRVLAKQAAVHSALLTPQGKLMFEFFVLRAADGDIPAFLLETASGQADALVKRLNMFRLRAKVEAENVSAGYEVAAYWGGAAPAGSAKRIVYADPRLPELGARLLAVVPPGLAADPGDVEGEAEWVEEAASTGWRWACLRRAGTSRSVIPSRMRPTLTSCTASRSPRAASSARRWWRA